MSRRPAAFVLIPLFAACSDHTVKVYREPPTVSIQEPSDGSTFYDGQDISFLAQVQSYDDTDLTTLSHYWVAGNETLCEEVPVEADGSAACSASFDVVGEYSVMVTVSDPSFGLVNSPPITIVITENQAPSITITAPEDGDLYATDDLIVFDALVSDSEESSDRLSVSIDSSLDGDLGLTATPASSGEYSAGAYLSEGTHLVTAHVYDSYGRSDQDTVTIEVYEHAPPSVEAVSITPSPAYTTDDLVANPQGWSDLDGATERYTYAWYMADETGAMVLDPGEATDSYPAGKTAKGDMVQVEVVPYNDYGDGDSVVSPTITIKNSLPTAPVVSISPSSPQPEDDLQCQINTPSSDADADTVGYGYTWYQNGALTALTANVVDAMYTAHGDTWECIVTPNDGEADGPTASDSVTVTDVTAPDAPVIDTPNAYRNDDSVSLTGTCEAGCSLTFYCADSTTSWSDTDTCDSAGEFEYSTSLTRGDTSTCTADCTDAAGNTSSMSNAVNTEVCDPYDEYEDSTGYGDAGSDAIDEWSAISDDGTSTITIEANILDDDTEDWYVVSSSDDVSSDISAGIDYYNFYVEMVDGSTDYAFIVYKSDPDPTYMECPSSTSGYTQYNDYVDDVGDGVHSVPSDTRTCGSGSSSANDCEDMSNDYYIQVFRRSSSVTSCQHYELEITNGVW